MCMTNMEVPPPCAQSAKRLFDGAILRVARCLIDCGDGRIVNFPHFKEKSYWRVCMFLLKGLAAHARVSTFNGSDTIVRHYHHDNT